MKVNKKIYQGCMHPLKEFRHRQKNWISGWFKISVTSLLKFWALVSEIEMIYLENGYLLIRFEDLSYVLRVFEGRPLMILGHYEGFQIWPP